MAKLHLSSVSSLLLLLLLLLSLAELMAGLSSFDVKYLPGFEGPLPFHLETGYVGVGESEDVQLFYYFFKSEKSPENDPVLLWLVGGPGCSAMSAIAFEIGPFNYVVNEHNRSLPTLGLNPFSWTKEANLIFVDSPVGTGFSYARTPNAFQPGDFNQIHQIHQFLRKWLTDHPEFIPNPFYVGGDSYTGIPLPVIVQEILNENEQGAKPLVNLQGYLLGNPGTLSTVESNFLIPFCHGMGLISDELYKSLKQTCKGVFGDLHPLNQDCLQDLDEAHKCIAGINTPHILEPICFFYSPKPRHRLDRRSLYNSDHLFSDSDPDPDFDLPFPPITCRSYGYLLCRNWANDPKVQKALHVREGSIGEWKRCGLEDYHYEISSSFPYHVNLSARGVRSLIYSGDHDMVVPYLGTEAWIRLLNYSINDDWRPWLVRGQVAGFTRTYSNKMTYATVKGGGHTAPEYKPEECLAMFTRWVSGRPL